MASTAPEASYTVAAAFKLARVKAPTPNGAVTATATLAKPAPASKEKKSRWPVLESMPLLLTVKVLLAATRTAVVAMPDARLVEGARGVAALMLLPCCCGKRGSLVAMTARSSCVVGHCKVDCSQAED